MRRAIVLLSLLVAACGTAPATVSVDPAKAAYYLQSVGCLGAIAASIAAPTVAAVSDAKGNAVLSAVGASAVNGCQMTVPAAAVAPAPSK